MDHSLEKVGRGRRSLGQSPLLGFTVVGLVLAVVHWQWQERRKPEIELTAEAVTALELHYQRLSGVLPDEEARALLLNQEVEEEVLYRESVRAGNVEDPRVKALLASILRESLEPVLADPSEEELRAFREEDPSAYQFPAEAAFEHVSFRAPAEVPERALARLRAGEVVAGDAALKLANPLPRTFAPQLEKMFGPEFFADIERCEVGSWEGPFDSVLGVHFVRVTDYREAREMDFERVKSALTSQWRKKTRAEAVSARVEEMKGSYRIILPEEGQR